MPGRPGGDRDGRTPRGDGWTLVPLAVCLVAHVVAVIGAVAAQVERDAHVGGGAAELVLRAGIAGIGLLVDVARVVDHLVLVHVLRIQASVALVRGMRSRRARTQGDAHGIL